MRSHTILALGLTLAGCSQPATHDQGAAGKERLAAGAVKPAEPSAAKATDDDDALPTEKFADGARAFAKVRESLLQNYYAEGLTEDDLYRAATAGMLEKIDPTMRKWNRLVGPAEHSELKNDLRGELVGIGVHIQFDEKSGYADVLSTIPGSPSEKAGLVTGDKIVTVNGKLYKGMRLEDVVADIRGKAGEPVALSVLRADKLVVFNVPRERVAYNQATAVDLPDAVGLVRIQGFTEKTPATIRASLEDFEKKGIKALIVDLRQCPGGAFDPALETASLFLPEGTPIVTLKHRGKPDEKRVAKGKAVLAAVPSVVLVNENTSSGCEILASALQEGRHARIVGKKTFGKWSLQSLDELPNGYAFKYTISLFTTPSGRTFGGTGLAPDVEVSMEEATLIRANAAAKVEDRLALDSQLRTAKELLVRAP